jgi:hypothetical protein
MPGRWEGRLHAWNLVLYPPDGVCHCYFKFRPVGNNILGVETVAGYELRLPIHLANNMTFPSEYQQEFASKKLLTAPREVIL